MAQSQQERIPMEEQEKAELLRENQKIKEEMICKVCKDNLRNRALLPFGHLVLCHLCISACIKCPICRCSIRGYVCVYTS